MSLHVSLLQYCNRFASIIRPYLSKRIGHDSKTSFINAVLGAKSLGTRGESIRFKIRKKINKSTAAKAKTTRFAMLCYKMEPSTMRNYFRIHARDASRNILVFVTHFSSGDGRPLSFFFLFFFYLFTNLHIYIFRGRIFVSSSLSNSYLHKNPATKNLLGWPPLHTRTGLA